VLPRQSQLQQAKNQGGQVFWFYLDYRKYEENRAEFKKTEQNIFRIYDICLTELFPC